MTVSEKPEQTMYLRGFIGDTYEGTYWHRIDEDEFYKEFSEKDAAYQIQNILYRYVQKRAQEEENTAVVRRVQPGGEYGYVPYGFQVPDDGNLVGDSYYASTEETGIQRICKMEHLGGKWTCAGSGIGDRGNISGICSAAISESSGRRSGPAEGILRAVRFWIGAGGS